MYLTCSCTNKHTHTHTQSPVLLRAFTDAALARVQALALDDDSSSSSSTSHRAAVAYLLQEWLRSLEPTLFPPAPAPKVVDTIAPVLKMW